MFGEDVQFFFFCVCVVSFDFFFLLLFPFGFLCFSLCAGVSAFVGVKWLYLCCFFSVL